MKMTGSRYFLDSSVWISYFFAENEEVKGVIDSNNVLFTSVISIFEVKRKLLRDKTEKIRVSGVLSFIKEKSIITKLDQDACENAAEISIAHKIPAIDSLIYTSSLANDSILVTEDSHFKNLEKVKLIV